MPNGVKSSVLLRPYSHVPTPLQLEALPNYVEQELIKIEVPLNVLTEHYAPSITVSLSQPAGSIDVTGTPTPIDDYQAEIVSRYADDIGLVVDPLAGTISLNGDGNADVTLMISGFMTLDKGTLGNNELLSLQLTDGTITTPLGTVWITAALQTTLSLGAIITLNVKNNVSMFLTLNSDGTPGTLDFISGYFTVQFVSGVLQAPPP